MKVLFAAPESAPFFKSGGLGDVIGALPMELARNQEMDVRVVLPYYTVMPEKYKSQLEDVFHFDLNVNGWESKYCGIKQLKYEGVTYYFIDNLEYFDRENLYGYEDDGKRFSFFSLAVLETLQIVDFIPDILHVHDWQTAVIPVLLKDKYRWIEPYRDIRTILTLHNLEFQGRFGQEALGHWLGIGYEAFHERGLKQYEDVNFLKGGMYYADMVTTVSPNYMYEIQTPEFGFGLDGVLRDISYKTTGIINGIDWEEYNPATDEQIKSNFDKYHLDGKIDNKLALQHTLGLAEDKDLMLIGMVTRLTEQKGMQLIEMIMSELMKRPVQFAILGTGEPKFENSLKHFNWRYPDQHAAVIEFDSQLAKEIYAGVDLFLMPSAFEPCGLAQMIAMRYGTLPLVHEVGGLKDTVEAFNQFEVRGTGFTFDKFNPAALMSVIDEALRVYYDYPENWASIQEQAMSQDFSWKSSAREYIDMYKNFSY